MLGWITGKHNGKHEKRRHRNQSNYNKSADNKPSAPPEPDPIQQQQMNEDYHQALKLHNDQLHEQQATSLRKQTIYKDTIWCSVTVDTQNMFSDGANSSVMNELDTSSHIASTDIHIETEAEEGIKALLISLESQDEQEQKQWDEWMEQYQRKQELKQNIKETVHKTAVFGKHAWRKSVAFTTTATSKLLSATNTALAKREQSRKEKENEEEQNMTEGKQADDATLYNDEGKQSAESKGKQTYREAAWGFLEKKVIHKYAKKKPDDNDRNDIDIDPQKPNSAQQ